MTTTNELPSVEVFPKPPSPMRLVKVERVFMPHPYCIGAKHVGHASDCWGGMLGEEAIRDGERKGIVCDTCRELHKKRGTPVVPFEEHKSEVALFIAVPDNTHAGLNALPGLKEYLLLIGDQCRTLGVEGFAFPQELAVV